MLLVTGATGTTGMEVLRALKARGAEARALVRDETKAHHLRDLEFEPVTGDLGDPYERQMRSRSGAVPSGPHHHSHKTRGSRLLSPRGRRSTSTRMSVPTTMGRGLRLPRPSWFRTLGCSSAHARTRTDP